MKGKLSQKGFTLIELFVVIAVVTLAFGLVVPRFFDSVFSDPLMRGAYKLIASLREAKAWALENSRPCALVLNFEENSYRIEPVSGSEAERLRGFSLPNGVTLSQSWIMGEGSRIDGKARILFTHKGYTRPALIYLREKGGREVTIELSPFMAPQAQEGRVEIERS